MVRAHVGIHVEFEVDVAGSACLVSRLDAVIEQEHLVLFVFVDAHYDEAHLNEIAVRSYQHFVFFNQLLLLVDACALRQVRIVRAQLDRSLVRGVFLLEVSLAPLWVVGAIVLAPV